MKSDESQLIINGFIKKTVEDLKGASVQKDKFSCIMRAIQFNGLGKQGFDAKRKKLHEKIETLTKEHKKN